MAKPKDPASTKPLHDEAGSSAPDASHASEELDLIGLKALRQKLATLRTDDDGLDKSQLTSVQALISFAAYERGVNEDVMRTLVCKQFGISDIANIPGKNYEEVRRFLTDLNIKGAMN